MRELSIQSANGIYSDANRATLNAEVTQLKAELTRIAETTSFNGLKILDGTLGDIELQVGSESGERIKVNTGTGFDAESLGQAADITSSSGEFTLSQSKREGESGSAGSLNSLQAGDMLINGIEIPAGTGFDGVSKTDNEASALAYSEAINSVSDQTGVTATALTEVNLGAVTLEGSLNLGAVTATADYADGGITLAAGDLVINGIDMAGTYGADVSSGSLTLPEKFIADLNAALAGKAANLNSGTPIVDLSLNSDGELIATTTDADGVIDIYGDGTVDTNVATITLGTYAPPTGTPSAFTANQFVVNGIDFDGTNIPLAATAQTAVDLLNADTDLAGANWEFVVIGSDIGIRSFDGPQEFTISSVGSVAGGPTIGVDTSATNPTPVSVTTVANGASDFAFGSTDFNGGAAITLSLEANKVTLGADDFVINQTGIEGSFNTSAELVALINDKSSITGVTASIVSDEIILKAEDGRNILLSNDADVNVGSEDTDLTVFELSKYDLNSDSATVYSGEVILDGASIEITGEDASGFNTSVEVKALQQTTMTDEDNPVGGTFDSMSNGDLTINGYTVDFDGASYTGLSFVDDGASAAAIANAINTTSGLRDEVTATATTVMNLGNVQGGTADNGFILTVNGVDVDIDGTITDGDSNGLLTGTLNSVFASASSSSKVSGLVASIDSATGDLLITAEDGRNITVQVAGGEGNTVKLLENLDTTSASDIVAYSTKGTIALTAKGDNSVGEIGGEKSYLAGIENGNDTIANIDISTQTGAQDAIAVVDRALDYIADARGDLGAASNRLEFTINNLSSVVENAAAARSRVQDADFAVESAALARAQVLQQAGTAMLAQANAAPQSVLSLLQ